MFQEKKSGISFTEQFGKPFSYLSSKRAIPRSPVPFLWAVAVLLIIIFCAIYNDLLDSHETLVRSNLAKSTRQVTLNIEQEMLSLQADALQAIANFTDHDRPRTMKDEAQRILRDHPEVILIRSVLPNGKAVDTFLNDRFEADAHIRKFSYLDSPEVLRDAISEAFARRSMVISSYWNDPETWPSYSVAMVIPYHDDEDREFALLIRISLRNLLERAVEATQSNEFEYSLVHGNTVITGAAPFKAEEVSGIPSVVMPAHPLPTVIQLLGCRLPKSPFLLSSPFLLGTAAIIIILLLALFILSRSIERQRKLFDEVLQEVQIRREIEFSMTYGIMVTDMDYRILFVNMAVERLTGYSAKELLGRIQPWPFLGNLSLPVVSTERVRDNANFPFRLDMKFEKKDEKTFIASILMTPFYSEKKKQTGWLFLVRDNSAEAKAQFLINDALSSYQKLLNSVQSCISVVRHSPSGSILGIRNTPYTEQLGYTIDGHQAISNAFTVPFDTSGRREELVWVESLERWFSVIEIRMTLSEGNLATMQAALDVTVAKAASDSLERQAQKMEASARFISLGEMASTITHEINQPLTAISTYSNTALEVFKNNPNAFTQEKAMEVFTKISDQSKRIAKIIHNIRTFSHRKAASTSVVHISTLVTDSMELAHLIEKRSNVKIICEIEPNLPDVECDALQIVQVILNLIRNAADAIAEKKCPDRRIWFRIKSIDGGSYVRFEVADHGPGITDSHKQTLFLPFYTTKKDGLGLGLSICRSIIEAHSSRLRLEDNEGGGAVFLFELKAAT